MTERLGEGNSYPDGRQEPTTQPAVARDTDAPPPEVEADFPQTEAGLAAMEFLQTPDWRDTIVAIEREAAAALQPDSPEHDINCGIDPLHLGEDIGCTCYVRYEEPDSVRTPDLDAANRIRARLDAAMQPYGDIDDMFRAEILAIVDDEIRAALHPALLDLSPEDDVTDPTGAFE